MRIVSTTPGLSFFFRALQHITAPAAALLPTDGPVENPGPGVRLAASVHPSVPEAHQPWRVEAPDRPLAPRRPPVQQTATANPTPATDGNCHRLADTQPARLRPEKRPAPGRPIAPWQTRLPFDIEAPPADAGGRGVRVRRAPAEAGRIVISGRMDEVCAELDRLVACEALVH